MGVTYRLFGQKRRHLAPLGCWTMAFKCHGQHPRPYEVIDEVVNTSNNNNKKKTYYSFRSINTTGHKEKPADTGASNKGLPGTQGCPLPFI